MSVSVSCSLGRPSCLLKGAVTATCSSIGVCQDGNKMLCELFAVGSFAGCPVLNCWALQCEEVCTSGLKSLAPSPCCVSFERLYFCLCYNSF